MKKIIAFVTGDGKDRTHLIGSIYRVIRDELKSWYRSLLLVRLYRKAKAVVVQQLAMMPNLKIIRHSKLFDPEWYLREYPDVKAARMDPAVHYLLYGGKERRDPSPLFCSDEYLSLNGDVKFARMNPLLHYEQYGRFERRPVSACDASEVSFPDEAVACEWDFPRKPAKYRRTVVFASYFGAGVVPESTLIYLRGLAKIADNIVFVSDCPILPSEKGKLQELVTHVKCLRHMEYDFGSYKKGFFLARELGLLNKEIADELVVANDSCYGPVYPFSEAFDAMGSKEIDFWGMSSYCFFGKNHIQSFFFVFRRTILDDDCLDCFFTSVGGCSDRWQVIIRYELQLTEVLSNRGFKWESYLPLGAVSGAPIKKPYEIIRRFRFPLLKVKALKGDSVDDPVKVVGLVKTLNSELAAVLPQPVPRESVAPFDPIDWESHQKSFPDKISLLREKIKNGQPINVVFMVVNASMFAARPLFDEMRRDSIFKARICVVPDFRWKDDPVPRMERVEEELGNAYGDDSLIRVRSAELGCWPDVLQGVDMVVYSLPYDVSSFRYNPRSILGRNILSICVNYGYYRSKYDRTIVARQNYAYFWKVICECDANLEEYREYSICGGMNAEVLGYVKMDRLATVVAEVHDRRRVLIAPHHSVVGGANKEMQLSNFLRYAKFFLSLPDRYPEIDFVFRPHPFLFTVLAKPGFWGPCRVQDWCNELRSKPNVIWSDGGDYFKEFVESDGCIQDCGSYLVEYLYTQKPCCYMLKCPTDIDDVFTPFGKDCLNQCYLAYNEDAIIHFVEDVIIAGNDSKAESRRAFAKTVMVNYPHVAAAIIGSVKQSLGI